MSVEKDRNRDPIEQQIDEALHVEPVGAALTGRILENVRMRAEHMPLLMRIPGPVVAAMGSAIAASIVGLGYATGTIAPLLFEVGGAGDLSIILFDDAQNLLEIL